MHGELAGRTGRAAPDRPRSSLEWNGDSRLRALLLEDAASDEAAIEVKHAQLGHIKVPRSALLIQAASEAQPTAADVAKPEAKTGWLSGWGRKER